MNISTESKNAESLAALLGQRLVARNEKLERFLISRGLKLTPASLIPGGAKATAASRLVKGSEFPTHFFPDSETGEALEVKTQWEGEGSTEPGAYTMLSYREWDDTFRLRPMIEAKSRMVPAPSTGARLTETITRSGKNLIDESARYLAGIKKTVIAGKKEKTVSAGKGFTTMVTFTLDKIARSRVTVQTVDGDYCNLGSRMMQVVEGDYSDLHTGATVAVSGPFSPLKWWARSAVELHGRYCPIEFANGVMIAHAEVEGTHTLKPVTTVQQELSRSLDAMQKMYQRGFHYAGGIEPGRATAFYPVCDVLTMVRTSKKKDTIVFERKGGIRIPRYMKEVAEIGTRFTLIKPQPEKLRYLWVAENPSEGNYCDLITREELPGNTNPHIHMLMSWEVPHAAFADWVARIEGIWGQGFAHVERLRDQAAAGAYVLKAAGYVAGSKGSGKEDQGWIFGNRYFMSRDAAAPKYQSVAVLPYGQLPLLMAHAHEHQRDKLEPLRAKRRAARDAISKANNPTPIGKSRLTGLLKAWGKRIEGRPIIAGKWQVLLRGMKALTDFLGWAGSTGHTQGCELLPVKPAGFGWQHSMHTSHADIEQAKKTPAWHTTHTHDVLTFRGVMGEMAGRFSERLRELRQERTMPESLKLYDWDQLLGFYERFEPVAEWA